MPRGAGKKENYNFDYSRFNGCEQEEVAGADAAAGQGAGMPPDILEKMPADLRDAMRLMSIARATGNEDAQKRANELALEAVQRGSPQVKREFMAHLSKEAPGVATKLASELNHAGDKANMAKVLEKVTKTEATPVDEMSSKVDQLKAEMQAGAEATRKQLEALQKQQEQLEHLRSPEELFAFTQQGGLMQEDLQRIFSGDEQHMEKCVRGMLDKASSEGTAATSGEHLKNAEEAVKAAEELHRTLFSDGDTPDGPVEAAPPGAAGPEKAAQKTLPAPPPEPPVVIPAYRLQYKKSEDGKYMAVELTCCLPGIKNIADIELDVSEKHLRLSTALPGPRYAVNAGPFPVLIDKAAATAKFSKKQEELRVTVPAKVA